ncbi:ABC-2 type transport system permease protein [Thermonema lapsum]|uniref:Transport permease protein n=1 Tax=Thermonema lapsum TaxID=28195 RepID=A0A846MT55_9BACT|nr:ABC transporter permease [Thermonema lapsum]NIK74753.1 ABC-2 type transport system permease protein [Thermonema lapsum]
MKKTAQILILMLCVGARVFAQGSLTAQEAFLVEKAIQNNLNFKAKEQTLRKTILDGKVNNLPVAVIDEDHSPLSHKLMDMIDDTETLELVACLPSRSQAAEWMPRVHALIVIPDGFEADILYKRQPEVLVEINTANILTANYTTRALQQALGTFNAGMSVESLKKQGKAEAIALQELQPVRVFYHRRFNESANYAFFLYPGMLASILQQVLLLALALSMAAEWERGSWHSELLPLQKSAFYWVSVKAVPYLLMAAGIWLLYAVFFGIFRVPLPAHLPEVSAAALLMVLAASALGILVSAALPNQLKATEVLMVVATPAFVLSGFTYPLSQMPEAIQKVARCLPLTPFLEIYRVVGIMGASPRETVGAWLTLAVQVVGYGLLACLAVYYLQRRARHA